MLLGHQPTIHTYKLSFIYLNQFFNPETNKYILTDGLELIKDSENNTKVFHHSFKVYLKNKLIGLLHTDPALSMEVVQFKFNKKLFYNNEPIQPIIQLLERVLHLQYSSISQVHIAMDVAGKEVLNQAFEVERYCSSNNYFTHLQTSDLPDNTKTQRLSEVKYRPIIKTKQPFRTVSDTQLTIGKIKNPSKSISIYDKSEFAEPYQQKYFAKHLNTTTVTRIEVKLKREHLKDQPFNLKKINDVSYLQSYFMHEVKDWLAFNTNGFTYDSNRNKVYNKVSLLPYVNTTATPFIPEQPEQPEPQPATNNYNKRYLKSLIKDHILNNKENKSEILSFTTKKSIAKDSNNATITTDLDVSSNVEITLSVIKDIATKHTLTDLTNYNNLLLELGSIYKNESYLYHYPFA